MAATTNRVELDVRGMTCASCVARVEKRLNELDGVNATVNLATEKAVVDAPADVTVGQLVEAVESLGYTASVPDARPADEHHGGGHVHGDDDEAELRQRLLVSLVLTVPVVLISMIPSLQFDNWQWLALTLASPVVIWGGLPFHRATWVNLRHGAATMDTLISLGTLAAYSWSLYALYWGDAGMPDMRMKFDFFIERGTGTHEIYLEVAAGVIVFLLTGRWLEAKAKRRSGAALRALLEMGAKDVGVLRDGREERIPVDELRVGDHFVVRPGEKVATDGIVEEGTSAIDASLLTGESVPIEVAPGDAVTGATVNVGGRLIVQATKVGADTALAQIAQLVSDAQAGKSNVQRLADRISAVFVPAVIVLAAATLAGWLLAGEDAATAVTAAVAVVIIACPCALGLATPTALLVGTGRGAQLGILIKGPEVLESTRRVDTVLLDKTGTVTTGTMALIDVVPTGAATADEALGLAGSIEEASEHPIARAIARAAADRGLVQSVDDFQSHSGLGAQGRVDGRVVVVGREQLLRSLDITIPAELADAATSAAETGRTPVLVAWDGTARALLAVADTVKQTSAQAVAELQALGLHPVLLSGDDERVARAVAVEVGVDDVIAEVLPAGKVDEVRRLQAEGRVVAMVGDGVNDAAALAQADLGIAMGTGTDVAIEASDITLVRGDLRSVVVAIKLARATLRTIKGNLFWAFAYNLAALPLAAAGYLNPLIAGAAMAFSSVFVVTNSLRLRRFATQ